MYNTLQIYVLTGFPLFAVFQDEFEARISPKAFFSQPNVWLNILQNVFFLACAVKKCLKALNVLYILDQIILSDTNLANLHKLRSTTLKQRKQRDATERKLRRCGCRLIVNVEE